MARSSDTEEIERTLQHLLNVAARHGHQLEPVKEAARFAQERHDGQRRRSGEPYITHPLSVAALVADLNGSTSMIQAAILHDTLEDTATTDHEITDRFGEEVTHLVEGCTKTSVVHPAAGRSEQQAANLRKLFVALAADPRVVVIKLCDRLHNLRTIEALPPEKQRRIGEESLAIHAPLAHRLGLGAVKAELEDRAFAAADPEGWREITEQLSQDEGLHEILVRAAKELEEHLNANDAGFSLSGRVKHAYSARRKSMLHDVEPRELPDLLGLRVICETEEECYRIVSLVHDLWEPDLTRFKDYIARPKFNSYQSLHTTVTGPDEERLEVQVRTREMHAAAEHGSAAHHAYKNPGQEPDWLNRLLDWNEEASDEEYLLAVREELETRKEILVITPMGEVITLPAGASVIDFAYAIHSKVGDRCTGAKVDGKMVSLDTRLANGSKVEILTGNRNGPSLEWLEWAVTSKARNRIRASIRTASGRPAGSETASEVPVARKERIQSGAQPSPAGLRGTPTRLAGCCRPVPGSRISGLAGVGIVTVHGETCDSYLTTMAKHPGRRVNVYWTMPDHHVENVHIRTSANAVILTEIENAVRSAGGAVLRVCAMSESSVELDVDCSTRRNAGIRAAIRLVEGVIEVR